MIEDLVYISRDEEVILKLRSKWNSLYKVKETSRLSGSNDDTDSGLYETFDERPKGYIPGNYIIPGENGHPGLREAPLK